MSPIEEGVHTHKWVQKYEMQKAEMYNPVFRGPHN